MGRWKGFPAGGGLGLPLGADPVSQRRPPGPRDRLGREVTRLVRGPWTAEGLRRMPAVF